MSFLREKLQISQGQTQKEHSIEGTIMCHLIQENKKNYKWPSLLKNQNLRKNKI
jgi:hypothetical protein